MAKKIYQMPDRREREFVINNKTLAEILHNVSHNFVMSARTSVENKRKIEALWGYGLKSNGDVFITLCLD